MNSLSPYSPGILFIIVGIVLYAVSVMLPRYYSELPPYFVVFQLMSWLAILIGLLIIVAVLFVPGFRL